MHPSLIYLMTKSNIFQSVLIFKNSFFYIVNIYKVVYFRGVSYGHGNSALSSCSHINRFRYIFESWVCSFVYVYAMHTYNPFRAVKLCWYIDQ